MFKSKAKAEGIRGRKLDVDDKSVEESELAAFISSLIDQNGELLNKQEHLQSLTKLLEKAVLKAQEEANNVRAKAEKEASASAAAIIKKAEKEANDIIAEARQKSEAAERQAQELVMEASEEVESIKGLAKEEASRLIADVKQKAECSAEARIVKAEEEGRKIINEAIKTAETESQSIRQKAEQVFSLSQKLGEDEVGDSFERFCEGLISSSAAAVERAAVSDGRGKIDIKRNFTLYEGTVELNIPPPIALDKIIKLHRHLRGTPDIKIMKVRGTPDKGLKMQIHLRSRTPLIKILEALPEVKKASDPLYKAGSIEHSQTESGKRPIRKIVVKTRS